MRLAWLVLVLALAGACRALLGFEEVTIARDASVADAAGDGTPIDAAIDAFVCPDTCTSCDGTSCVIDCAAPTANCTSEVVCPPGLHCLIKCNLNNNCDDGVDCRLAASCKLECDGNAACGNVQCGNGACDVRCGGSGSCQNVLCGTGRCAVACTGTGSCQNVICDSSCACDVGCDAMACMNVDCPSPVCDTGTGCSSSVAGCDLCP